MRAHANPIRKDKVYKPLGANSVGAWGSSVHGGNDVGDEHPLKYASVLPFSFAFALQCQFMMSILLYDLATCKFLCMVFTVFVQYLVVAL